MGWPPQRSHGSKRVEESRTRRRYNRSFPCVALQVGKVPPWFLQAEEVPPWFLQAEEVPPWFVRLEQGSSYALRHSAAFEGGEWGLSEMSDGGPQSRYRGKACETDASS